MQNEEKTIQMRWMEVVVAGFFMLIGAIVIYDSFRTGFRWASDGPQPGYFPFYIGVILTAGAAWVLLQTLITWRKEGGEESFASHEEFGLVLKMLLPTVAFVAVMMFMGIYVSGIIFITAFMVWQGKYSYLKAFLTGFGVLAVLYGLFELWFLVPLPKGPFEEYLLDPVIQMIRTALA